mmetsp:Transcript_5053/g.7134  ORF Transcript_5053/g.7134 Transcript_5053/m.7134 type:complete len:611 (+) Transcript_5053:162-1994(+)
MATTKSPKDKKMIEDSKDGYGALSREVGGAMDHRKLHRKPLPKHLRRSLWADNVSFSSGSKKILKDVTCFATPGDILAIMGPSGAGKTTLMDLLAGREMNRFRGFKGEIRVNGRPRSRSYIEFSGHTASTPFFISTLTVRETIEFAAQMCIAESKARQIRVNTVIEELYLERCEHNYIGGALLKGISDGERKRLAIALQLLRTPSILLLDEPTSGLDTSSSRQVVSILRSLADRGFTIVVNIHAPDSMIYSQFDRLLVLVAGNVQYFGKSKLAVELYEKACRTQIRQYQNPAEFLFECAVTQTCIYREQPTLAELDDRVPTSGPLQRSDATISGRCRCLDASSCWSCCCFGGGGGGNDCGSDGPSSHWSDDHPKPPGCIWQCFTLLKRTFVDNCRNLAKYHIRCVIYILIGVLIGTAWRDLKPTFSTLHDRQTMLMVIIVFYSFMQVASLPSFLTELKVMNQEVLDGQYPVLAHILQSLVAGLLPNLILAASSSWVIFTMVGIGDEGGGYFIFMINVFLLLYVAESFAEFLCTFTSNLLIALCVYAAFFTTSFIAMGLLRALSHLPPFWRPFHYISFHKYSIDVFMWNAFHGWATICDVKPARLCKLYHQ